MLSIRSFTRSAPRIISRLTTSSIRQPIPARSITLLQSTWKPAVRTQSLAAFSTSVSRGAKAGESDDELVAKLDSEIQMEKELDEENGLPTSIKDYLENGPFELLDTPGREEVVLTRQFGDESIKVTFSIADLNNIDPEADYNDRAMEDEDDNPETINQGSPKSFAQAPEDSLAASDTEDAEEDSSERDPSFPCRVNITISKPSKITGSTTSTGALSIDTVAQDGMIVIENVYYYPSAEHAHAKSADKLFERQDLYAGPPFGNLDEDLQVLLERYLDERGVNTALALFVPDYIDLKEQREYARWLENVRGFVAA